MTQSVRVAARRALSGDTDLLVELYGAGREAVAGQRGGELDNLLSGPNISRSSWRQRYESLIDAEDGPLVLVGEVDDVGLGYVLARIVELHGGSLMRVEELFVLPGARGVGIGRALMDRVVDEACVVGCRGIDARALPGDRSTKNFFESFGLVARSILVHRDLRGA